MPLRPQPGSTHLDHGRFLKLPIQGEEAVAGSCPIFEEASLRSPVKAQCHGQADSNGATQAPPQEGRDAGQAEWLRSPCLFSEQLLCSRHSSSYFTKNMSLNNCSCHLR